MTRFESAIVAASIDSIELSNLDDGIEKFAQFEVSTQPLLYWVDCVVISFLWVSAWGARQIFCWNDHYAILLLKITSNQTNVLTWATFQFTWFPFMTFEFVELYRSISNVFWFFFVAPKRAWNSATLALNCIKSLQSDYILAQHHKHTHTPHWAIQLKIVTFLALTIQNIQRLMLFYTAFPLKWL